MSKGGVFYPLKDWSNCKWETQKINNATFLDYYDRLRNLAINMFEWKNVPDTIDVRFLELTLCERGFAVYFDEPDIGNLALTCMISGPLNIYRIPTRRRAYAVNGFQRDLSDRDSVIIYNNYLHTPSMLTVILYARRLYEIERTIEVNVKAQKTPVIILCSEQQRLTLENIYKKYDGNYPVIFGAKDLDLTGVTSLKTDAPYVAADLYTLKRQIWNEALTFFGIANSNTEKKERLVTDEITSNLGGVEAQRYVMLNARRDAAAKINEMFGTNIEVDFRQDIAMFNPTSDTTTFDVDNVEYEGGEE